MAFKRLPDPPKLYNQTDDFFSDDVYNASVSFVEVFFTVFIIVIVYVAVVIFEADDDEFVPLIQQAQDVRMNPELQDHLNRVNHIIIDEIEEDDYEDGN